MLAGVLMLAAVWVVVLRYIPDGVLYNMHPSWQFILDRSDPLHGFTLGRGNRARVPAGVRSRWRLAARRPHARPARLGSRTPHARPRPDRSPIGSSSPAARTSSASSPTPSTRCSRASRHTWPSNSGSQPTPRTSCAPRWRSRRRFSTWLARPQPRHRRADRPPPRRQRPRDRPQPRHCSYSAEPTNGSFTSDQVDLSLVAEEATETLLPFAERRDVTIETSGDVAPTNGSHALLLQMTTNLVHNAIVHNLPEQGTVWVTTGVDAKGVELTVENTGEKLDPPVGFHARRAVSARHRTHTHRPRRSRPRPGDRREHHASTRREPHPRPARRRRAPRHGATTCRTAADRYMRWESPRPNRPRRHPTSCVIWSMQTVTARISASSWSGAISMP